jgi:thiol:disulfide interchange protein DsbG
MMTLLLMERSPPGLQKRPYIIKARRRPDKPRGGFYANGAAGARRAAAFSGREGRAPPDFVSLTGRERRVISRGRLLKGRAMKPSLPKTRSLRRFLASPRRLALHLACAALFALAGLAASPAARAENEPPLPPPLQNLIAEGAQMRYLGRSHGLDGWIAIQGGQEQYFYVTEAGDAFVLGLMFDRDGKMQTMRQVADLQQKSGGGLDVFADPGAAQADSMSAMAGNLKTAANPKFKTPSEQLYSDVEDANWLALGKPGAPFIYTFIDPQCPFCHTLVNDLRKDYIANGKIQVRMIPVGYKPGSMEKAAFLLAVPNPQERWYRELDGDKDALPITPGINTQGVQKNMAVMQSWKFNVTPLTVYRSKDGTVKIVQGRIKDIPALIADLAPPAAAAPQNATPVAPVAGGQ